MNKLLRVNMTNLTVGSEPLPEAYRLLGGRALTSRIVGDEVDPLCDPLGPNNKLVFATGLLSGTTASSSSRLSVGCKSPLTGGIKESNGGGQSGAKLAQLGYRAVIVEGQPAHRDQWYMLVIDREGACLESADQLKGLGAQGTADKLYERFSKKVGVSVIGTPGEMMMNLAGICNNDPEGRASRICARGAPGAVMGSKCLKAVVYNQPTYSAPPAVDPDLWKSGAKAYQRELLASPLTNDAFPKFGTAITLEKINKLGGLPIRNFTRGKDDRAEQIGGIAMRDTILERGGEGMATHGCMTGCTIRCSNVWADKDGKAVTSSLEFESNILLGSNLEIYDFDAIAQFTRECNDLAVDTIETGGTIGVAMEAGLARWGSVEDVLRLLGEIRQGTLLGRALGAGGVVLARMMGIKNVAAVKGQMMPAYDPRVILGNGVTYATCPMGADHTCANVGVMNVDQSDPAGKVEVSRDLQILTMLQDSMGFCVFNRAAWFGDPQATIDMFNARNGVNWTKEQVLSLCARALKGEIDFNRAAGLGKGTDRLPEYMRTVPLPPTNRVFSIPDEELDRIWEGVL